MTSSALLASCGKYLFIFLLHDESSMIIFLARRSIRSSYLRPIIFQQSIRTLHEQSESQGIDSNPAYDFVRRHVGPNERQTQDMLRTLGLKTLDELINKTVPSTIQFKGTMNIPEALCK
jgi:hypothetical protein